MSVRIISTDHGYDALLKAAKKLGGSVSVGVPDKPHEPSGEPTDEMAQRHEFGLGVPQRSFLRGWVDENEAAIRAYLRASVESEIYGGPDWRERFGQWAVDRIRERIWAHIPPELLPETIKRKGTTVPLINTGQLVNAILHELGQ